MYRDEGELEKYLRPYNPIWDIIICQEGESMNVLKIQYKMSVYYKILLLRNYSFFLTMVKDGKTHPSVQCWNLHRIQLTVFKAMVWAWITYSIIHVPVLLLYVLNFHTGTKIVSNKTIFSMKLKSKIKTVSEILESLFILSWFDDTEKWRSQQFMC